MVWGLGFRVWGLGLGLGLGVLGFRVWGFPKIKGLFEGVYRGYIGIVERRKLLFKVYRDNGKTETTV